MDSTKKNTGTNNALPRIGWCVASLSADIASVRYRAVLPLLALEEKQYHCTLFTHTTKIDLDDLDVLVIVKNFTVESFLLAQEARAKGVTVILDLCDNIFIEAYGKNSKTRASDMFMAIAKHASAIVATTEPLAAIIREQISYTVPVYVIPDGVEADASACARRLARTQEQASTLLANSLSQQANKVRSRISALRTVSFKGLLKAQLTRFRNWLSWRFWMHQGRKAHGILRSAANQCVRKLSRPAAPRSNPTVSDDATGGANKLSILWYGNHGAPHARFGMLDLLEIRGALEQAAIEFQAELVVVSNNRSKYEKYIKPMAIPSRYLEWSSAVVEQCLAEARVVVVPNMRDAFSLCKSANRTVHALTRGVPVVATATPALAPLAGSIVVDDFLQGLRRYLSSIPHAKADVAKGLELIEKHFSPEVIGTAWSDAIKAAVLTQGEQQTPADPELIVALHLIQDLDLALPVMLAAKARGIGVAAWCSISLLKKSPRVAASTHAHDIPLVAIAEGEGAAQPPFPANAKVLLSVAETNLGPHRFTHALTQKAKRAGLFTATMQHGLENVGLTYSDEVHFIEKIMFAADRIYLWGSDDTLHPNIRPETRAKCVSAGCPKPAIEPAANLSNLLNEEAVVIGVFENLHWHRYCDEYRQFFLDGVTDLAARFPAITFLVKPHHAGLWLTSRFKGDKPAAANIVIADPKDPAWEAYTAGSLLGRMKAVITTPSTVALDAARRSLPTAIVAHTLELDNYFPLHQIRHAEDWSHFVLATLDASALSERITASAQYVERMILAGDAAERIVDDLLTHQNISRKASI
ncbi:hypothetical protein [Pseudomonas sp. FP198]|uniref:hypothetical protein n=1 Tax=Pseudomonas sp. FP198 TaxID=2954084 RepID=UPI002735143F|nr:hypothetical protein [Pseudomonas sp. FP198]WLG96488.1 hypothetical protein PSH78_03545 [Pseudomonas sp. FP198]